MTGAALKEFLAEFARLSGGDVTPEEAGKARDIVKNAAVQSFSGLSGVLATATNYVELGAPFETLGEDLAAQAALDAPALNAHREKRARARPRRPRPRRGQGGDPAAAQGRRPPGSRRRRHVGRQTLTMIPSRMQPASASQTGGSPNSRALPVAQR